MKKKIYLLISLYLIATISTFAVAAGSYEGQLEELKKIVDVKFALGLPFIKKVQGIKKLTNFLKNEEHRQYFGEDAVIKSVVVDSYSYCNQIYTTLHEQTLHYKFDGSMDDQLAQALPSFESVLNTTKELEEHLETLFSDKIEFFRKEDSFDKTSPNFKYLQHLETFYQILQSNPEISAKLLTMDRIIVIDSVDMLTPTSAEYFQYHQFSTSKVFVLKFKTDRSPNGYIGVESKEFIKSLINITLMNEFFSALCLSSDNSKIETGINNLSRVLTPDNVTLLKEGGVKRFYFSTFWKEKENWLEHDGTLTIGFEEEEMLTVIDLLFK